MKTKSLGSSFNGRFSAIKQRGFALTDLMLALVVLGLAAVVGLVIYNSLSSSTKAEDMGDKTMMLVADIQKNWARINDYSTVTPEEVNKLASIRPPMRYDSGSLYDVYGNEMTLNGGPRNFALTIGGSTSPMTKDECAAIVSRLQSIASNINIGAATATAGVVSGGNAYKNGATITQSGLTDGCSATNPVIGAQFR